MEGFNPHSRPHSRAQTSKRPYNGNGFTVYDDVFGGPPKFGITCFAPRADDYTEIFGSFRSSRASSIPILDLPAVDDDVVSFDVRTSNFDYSEVFGSFDFVDFCVPYCELFKQSNGGDDSFEEAWIQAGAEYLSEESDPSAFLEKSHCFQTKANPQSFDSNHFNVSYHNADLGAREGKSTMIHVAQHNAVPGYTYVVDKATSLQKAEENFCSQVAEDIILSEDSSENISEEIYMRKTLRCTERGGTAMQCSDIDQKPGRAYVSGGSFVNSMFVSASDISLRTQPSHLPPPSRPPPILEYKNGDSGRLTSDTKAPKNNSSKITFDGSSPPLSDVGVDASSSAASSVAAMKQAMEMAQVKLETVKELMLRKKDEFQSHIEPCMHNDICSEEKVGLVFDECILKDPRQQATHAGEPNDRKSSGKGCLGAQNAMPVAENLFEQFANIARKPTLRKHKKKHSFSFDPILTEGTDEWKEVMRYHELITHDNSKTKTQLPINMENLMQETDAYQSGTKDGEAAALELQEASDERTKAARKAHEHGAGAQCSNSVSGACGPEDSRRKLKLMKTPSRREYYEKMVKVTQEVHERVICEHAEIENGLKGASEGIGNEKKLKMESEVEKNGIRLNRVPQQADVDKKCKHSPGREENNTRLREVFEREDKKKEKEACEREDNAGISKEALERDEIEKRAKEAHLREASERMKEAYKREENEWKLNEACAREENEQGVKEAYDREENERKARVVLLQKEDRERSEKTSELEEIGKGFKKAIEEGGKRITEVSEREGFAIKGAWEGAQNEKDLGEAVIFQGNDGVLKQAAVLEECKNYEAVLEEEKQTNRLDDDHKPVANKKESEEVHKRYDEEKFRQTLEQEEVSKNPILTFELEETKKVHEDVAEEGKQSGEYKGDWHGACSMNEKNVKPMLTEVACRLENLLKQAYASQEETANEGSDEMRTEPLNGKKDLKIGKTNDVLIDERKTEPIASSDVAENEQEEDRIGEALKSVHIDEKSLKPNGVCIGSREILAESKNVPNPSFMEECDCEQEQRRKKIGEVQVLFDQEKNEDRTMPTHEVNGFTEHVRQAEAIQSVISERKESFQKISQLPNFSPTAERKGKVISANFPSENEKMGRSKDDRQLENERLRKLEEEREREREREKDRMAVEIATREACERAYAEARERAGRAAVERATAEARQRAMAEARERLERACAEAREKASAEARLRAERAAVDQATAEARERAIEKAMAERAMFEARGDRSVSDKFSASSNDLGTRQSSSFSDLQNTVKFEGSGGESSQRCKARLERHRRTVERVAKAVAEKNMRDLLAQREQIERSRLAEALDADVRRWSSGKEGNLRALLSTLQYILGPDSGWQPIPLTEVITAAAVKKAYRKATLYVHPDKLQQRGASIQQKYICEKVFDLLKDAWNKFNSEER
ncbi:hypothetical protein Nepgr_025870 [Nepenthes gracilis]|uniref:J domain-containing protein n=1 Tax=Nepenthes gracilis TaxID=150966 RepID=A0AAD3XZW5_NEPGR|nr:hypothetical protein Nepgr_025870 [Nepenthes gracilis]